MIFYYLIFFGVLFLSIVIPQKKQLGIVYILSFILFVIAGLRSEYVGSDYSGYIDYYNESLNDSWFRVEPTFIFISKFVKYIFDDVIFLFLIYSALGVFLKSIAINLLTDLKILSILVYFSNYFLLFEMTQIRAGISSSLILISIIFIYNRKPFFFFLLSFFAISFHYSAVVMLPFYFLNPLKINKLFYVILIPIGYFISKIGLNTDYIKIIPVELIQMKIDSYSFYAEQDSKINLFNFLQLSRYLLFGFLLYHSKALISSNKYFFILIKIYAFGLFSFVVFSSIPGISSRISELLIIVEIILVPMIYYLFKNKFFGSSLVYLISIIFLTFSLFYTKIVVEYF